MEAPAALNVTPLNAPHRDLDFINKLFDFSRLPSEYGFGPTISILVDKIVYSKFSDFNSISSFNKQFVYKFRERLE